jgi:pyruvate/2-oxoglutarate/acetoin dehydrogenase E1 component
MASEICAVVSEECYDWLDAPIARVAAPDTPCPFSPPLEAEYIPGPEEIKDAIYKITGKK